MLEERHVKRDGVVRQYIVSAENANDFPAAVELDKETAVKIL